MIQHPQPRRRRGHRLRLPKALDEDIDVVCVMAADNQMDPAELEGLVEPVARGEVEYAKANGSSPARRGR